MKRKLKIVCGTIVGLFVLGIVLGGIFGGTSQKRGSTTPGQTVVQAPTTSQASTQVVHHRRHHWPQYAGLGSTIADFKHDNTMFCLSCALQIGEAAYNIKGQRNGRVTAYDVHEAFRPAVGEATRLSLVAGTMIPGPPVVPFKQTSDCADYRVPALKKLIGTEYAEASTYPGVNFATMQAVSTPGC